MNVICFEAKAFYALIEEVTQCLVEKHAVKEKKFSLTASETGSGLFPFRCKSTLPLMICFRNEI
jgi:hypothetical protein